MAMLHENRELFAEAINLAAYKTGLTQEIVEKDYYVTMILMRLAERFDYVVFKGGTSLQKCHQVIARFSEDIDIAVDQNLSQGKRRDLKYGIVDIVTELGLTIPNLDRTRSRRDYNRYEIAYSPVADQISGALNPAVLLETSFTEVSFPVVVMPVHSYIGDLFMEEAPQELDHYQLAPFSMKVQGIDRTLIDKVFAICDYYMAGAVRRHSRHIYDIYRLLPMIPDNTDLAKLVREVRTVRAKASICLSAQPGVDVTALLKEIIDKDVYKEDYNTLTVRLLADKVTYEEALSAIRQIADSRLFD